MAIRKRKLSKPKGEPYDPAVSRHNSPPQWNGIPLSPWTRHLLFAPIPVLMALQRNRSTFYPRR